MEVDEDATKATSVNQIATLSEESQSQSCARKYGDKVENDLCIDKKPLAAGKLINSEQNVIEIFSDSESVDEEKNSEKLTSSQKSASSVLDKYEPMDIDEILEGIHADTASEQETVESADLKENEFVPKTYDVAQQDGKC